MKVNLSLNCALDFDEGGYNNVYSISLEDGTMTDIVRAESGHAKRPDENTRKHFRGDTEYPTLKAALKAWFADSGREYPEETTNG